MAWAERPAPRGCPRSKYPLGMASTSLKMPPDCTDCIAACHAAQRPVLRPAEGRDRVDRRETFGRILQVHAHLEPASGGAGDRPVQPLRESPCIRVCHGGDLPAARRIVMMDYHRCIGCRFCIAACPYGARSELSRSQPFIRHRSDSRRRTKGVVEKCNFCVGGSPWATASEHLSAEGPRLRRPGGARLRSAARHRRTDGPPAQAGTGHGASGLLHVMRRGAGG